MGQQRNATPRLRIHDRMQTTILKTLQPVVESKSATSTANAQTTKPQRKEASIKTAANAAKQGGKRDVPVESQFVAVEEDASEEDASEEDASLSKELKWCESGQSCFRMAQQEGVQPIPCRRRSRFAPGQCPQSKS